MNGNTRSTLRRGALLALTVFTTGAFSTAGAQQQVGHVPERSPFVDLDRTHEVTVFAGPYLVQRDPARVAPYGGLAVGVAYAWRAGGPAHLTGEIARIGTRRMVVDPGLVGDAQRLGEEDWPLWAAEAGLGLSLTGPRTWHGLMPIVRGGVGFLSDLRTEADTGGFRFGTRFAFSIGTAVRWIPGGGQGRYQVRLDVNDRLHTIAYPETYYATPPGGTAVLPPTQDRSVWRHNVAITLGLSYLMGR